MTLPYFLQKSFKSNNTYIEIKVFNAKKKKLSFHCVPYVPYVYQPTHLLTTCLDTNSSFYCVCWRREYVCQPLAGLKESYVCQPVVAAGLLTTWAIWRLWQGRAPRNAPLDQRKARNIPSGNISTKRFGDCCKVWLLEMLLQTNGKRSLQKYVKSPPN